MTPFNPAVNYSNNPVPDFNMVVAINHSARGLADAPQFDPRHFLEQLQFGFKRINERLDDIDKHLNDNGVQISVE
jgi:hypothetical protein